MKKYIYIMLSVVLASLFAACSKDDPFGNSADVKTGGLLSSALDLSLNSEMGPRSVKSRNVRAAAPSLNNFKVAFYSESNDSVPYVTYDYTDMPEIITLPVGNYYAIAFYGSNPIAGWDAPYYEGKSNLFAIEEDEITDNVETITCKISNVRVSIGFSDELQAELDGNCTVEVLVGDEGKLNFSYADIQEGKSGYFRYVPGSNTLVVTFKGNVGGVYTEEVKTGADVEAGRYYAVTFNLHDAGAEDPGQIGMKDEEDGFIRVDATYSSEDIEWTADFEDSVIEDDLRPKEEDNSGKDDPTPDVPDVPSGEGPDVKVKAPLQFDVEYELVSGTQIVIDVTSGDSAGIQEFTCEIQSNVLTEEELEKAGLPAVLDLATTPDTYGPTLALFGFATNVKGRKNVTLDMSNFVDILLDAAEENTGRSQYYFVLTVKDAKGTTQKTLKLYNN